MEQESCCPWTKPHRSHRPLPAPLHMTFIWLGLKQTPFGHSPSCWASSRRKDLITSPKYVFLRGLLSRTIIWSILIKKLNMRKRNIKPTVRREVQRLRNNGHSLRSPTMTARFAVDDGTDTHQSHQAVSALGNLLFSGVTVVKRKEIAIWGKNAFLVEMKMLSRWIHWTLGLKRKGCRTHCLSLDICCYTRTFPSWSHSQLKIRLALVHEN